MLSIIFFTTENPEMVVNYPSVASLFFRIVLTLIFIIFVAYLVLKIIKRQQSFQQRQKKWIKIFDYQALGTNRGLYLAELYGIICIIAVSENQINILKEIDPHTEKWEEIKNSLEESEDLFIKGLGQLFKSKASFWHHHNKLDTDDFQQQLAEQFRRNKYLSRDLFRGRDKDE